MVDALVAGMKGEKFHLSSDYDSGVIVRYKENSVREWRNGRRASLRN
jgi:hypothetical protein